ncbi:hypothetical protein COY95_00915, partial [Candidatus Woesearchaeota archaeon CG_4_10_14_0_8_um_filter_47_5]
MTTHCPHCPHRLFVHKTHKSLIYLTLAILLLFAMLIPAAFADDKADCEAQKGIYVESYNSNLRKTLTGCLTPLEGHTIQMLKKAPTEELLQDEKNTFFYGFPARIITYTDSKTGITEHATLPEMSGVATNINNFAIIRFGGSELKVTGGNFETHYNSPNKNDQGTALVFNPEKGILFEYATFREEGIDKKLLIERRYTFENGRVKYGEIIKVMPVTADTTPGTITPPHQTYPPPDTGSPPQPSKPYDETICNKFGIFTLLQDVKKASDVGPYHGGSGPPLYEEHLGWAHDLAGNGGWVTEMVYADSGDDEMVARFRELVRIANSKNLRLIVRIMPPRECASPPCEPDAEGFWPGVLETEPKAQDFIAMIQALGPENIRYVQIYNEPNNPAPHEEAMSADAYAALFKETAQGIKQLNPKIKILNAGFNAGVGNTKTYIDALKANGALEYLDIWASHSFPSVGITVYKDEIGWLGKDVQVIITETGYEYPPQQAPNRRSMS